MADIVKVGTHYINLDHVTWGFKERGQAKLWIEEAGEMRPLSLTQAESESLEDLIRSRETARNYFPWGGIPTR